MHRIRMQLAGIAWLFSPAVEAIGGRGENRLPGHDGQWGRYIRESGKDLNWFKRDSIHANIRGEQILGRILAAHLIVGGMGLTLAAAGAEVPAHGPGGKPPNILFIFSDDHAYQAISAYNDPRRLIETPHIDRLAREGMRFDRCVVPNSICGPSRASVLTGKYSHRNGFYNNTNSRFDGSQTTFPKLLQAAGYQTAIFGKWHLVTDPTGFDEWHILPGQGVYYNPPMIRNGQHGAAQGLHDRHHHRS